jgi:hypothetical protein
MSEMGHQRRFKPKPRTSAYPPIPDMRVPLGRPTGLREAHGGELRQAAGDAAPKVLKLLVRFSGWPRPAEVGQRRWKRPHSLSAMTPSIRRTAIRKNASVANIADIPPVSALLVADINFNMVGNDIVTPPNLEGETSKISRQRFPVLPSG